MNGALKTSTEATGDHGNNGKNTGAAHNRDAR